MSDSVRKSISDEKWMFHAVLLSKGLSKLKFFIRQNAHQMHNSTIQLFTSKLPAKVMRSKHREITSCRALKLSVNTLVFGGGNNVIVMGRVNNVIFSLWNLTGLSQTGPIVKNAAKLKVASDTVLYGNHSAIYTQISEDAETCGTSDLLFITQQQ